MPKGASAENARFEGRSKVRPAKGPGKDRTWTFAPMDGLHEPITCFELLRPRLCMLHSDSLMSHSLVIFTLLEPVSPPAPNNTPSFDSAGDDWRTPGSATGSHHTLQVSHVRRSGAQLVTPSRGRGCDGWAPRLSPWIAPRLVTAGILYEIVDGKEREREISCQELSPPW